MFFCYVFFGFNNLKHIHLWVRFYSSKWNMYHQLITRNKHHQFSKLKTSSNYPIIYHISTKLLGNFHGLVNHHPRPVQQQRPGPWIRGLHAFLHKHGIVTTAHQLHTLAFPVGGMDEISLSHQRTKTTGCRRVQQPKPTSLTISWAGWEESQGDRMCAGWVLGC